MAKRKSDDLEFTNIDMATMPIEVQQQYARLKALWKEVKTTKEQLTTLVRGILPAPAGFEIVCGYQFGNFGIAYAPKEEKPAKKSKPVMSLAQFQAQCDASGIAR